MNGISLRWRSICAAGVLLALAVVMSGCGGSLGSRILPSPFEGQWSGEWADISKAENGTMTITIGKDGDLTGTIQNTTDQTSGSASGTIRSTGEASWTLTYPGPVTYGASGTVVKDSEGNLVGTLQLSTEQDASAGAMTLALQKQ